MISDRREKRAMHPSKLAWAEAILLGLSANRIGADRSV